MPTANLSAQARALFAETLADCSIDHAFNQKVKSLSTPEGTLLLLDGSPAANLNHLRNLRIIALGKAASPMLQALLPRLQLPPTCDLQGILIAPNPPQHLPPGFQFFPGGHPSPNQASFAAARAALTLLAHAASSPNTLCIFLISGGGSSMLELPLDPTISLDDTIAFHQALVHSGASITQINCVRKHFSAVKGGRLARAAAPAPTLSLFLSDVPRGHLDALASGPTLPDPSTVQQCREILAHYDLPSRFPPAVRKFFASPTLAETPKPETPTPAAHTCILLDSDHLAASARLRAQALNFHTTIDNTCDDWPYDQAARFLLDRIRALRHQHPGQPRICLISTGELSVPLPATSTPGTGGRNQHFALYATTLLTPADGTIAILSAGSDGIDGNSTAAGAVINNETLTNEILTNETSNDLLLQAQTALARFDSSPLLQRLGATLSTGPTGNNLRDLRILLWQAPH